MTTDFAERLEKLCKAVCRRLGVPELRWKKYKMIVEEELVKQESRKIFDLEKDHELLLEQVAESDFIMFDPEGDEPPWIKK